MPTENRKTDIFFLTISSFFLEFFKEIIFFPVWWYGSGLLRVGRWCISFWAQTARNLGVGIWIKNLFVPMYGETEIASRIISFFLRLFMIFVRGLGVLIWTVFLLIFFLGYLVLPLITIFGLFFFSYAKNFF